MNCPICESSEIRRYRRVYDDRYGYPGDFELWLCRSCSHKFLEGDFAPEILTRLYTDYYPRTSIPLEHFQPRRVAKGFSAWLDGDKRLTHCWVPTGVRVLDIGCGFGESLAYHVRRGCDAYGVEADENVRKSVEKFGFKIHVGLFDSTLYDPNFFDYVTLDQVVEHFADPVETLRGVAKILKPGGTVILSTPNANGWGAKVFGQRWINWHAPYHLQYFSRKSMVVAAGRADLKVVNVRTVTSSKWLDYQWNHLLTCPPEGTPSSYWSPVSAQVHSRSISRVAIAYAKRGKINHLLTRFFDALGIGDNFLFFLRKS